MRRHIQTLLSGTFIRYGIMAVIVVTIEIASFWLMNSVAGIHYLAATILSLLIGIILNWLGSRYFVFGSSIHNIKKEFALVAISSLMGVVLQSFIVYIAVEAIKTQPITGKALAIVITFFWNYIIRKKYIYRKHEEFTKA